MAGARPCRERELEVKNPRRRIDRWEPTPHSHGVEQQLLNDLQLAFVTFLELLHAGRELEVALVRVL